MATSTEILAADVLADWTAVKLEVEGNKDWDKAVFDKICTTTPYSASSCANKWSSAMAKAMWTYTDGYSLKLSATNAKVFDPLVDGTAAKMKTSETFQHLCLSKTTAAAKDNVGRAADGYMCFVWQYGVFHKMDYWDKDDFAATGWTAAKTAKWSVVTEPATFAASATTNGVAKGVAALASATDAQKKITATEFASEIFDNSASKSAIQTSDLNANFQAAIGSLVIGLKWYQPKWQKNDYYQYNFRVNAKDTVTVKHCDKSKFANTDAAASKKMLEAGTNCEWMTKTKVMGAASNNATSLTVAAVAFAFGAATIVI